jgi:predicted metal-dependent HD superfamily phosphohydrolase
MNKTRLITKGGNSRMISATKLHKRSRDVESSRLVVQDEVTTLAARPVASAQKPVVQRAKSEWGDERKENRRGRDTAAARAETRRENAPRQPIKSIIG